MTDVIIYKKIEVTIIRPSEENILVENEKAQGGPGMMCLDFSLAQVLLRSVKEGVGVSDTLRRHCHLSIPVTELLIDGKARWWSEH